MFVENVHGHRGLDASNYTVHVQEWARVDKTNMVAETDSEIEQAELAELAELSRRTACVVM